MRPVQDKVMVLNDIFSKKYDMTIIMTMLIMATCGSLMQITGTSWDVTSHIMKEPETFFTPSHTVLYAGVGLLTVAAGTSVILLIRSNEL
jgi:predicted acyltransferase